MMHCKAAELRQIDGFDIFMWKYGYVVPTNPFQPKNRQMESIRFYGIDGKVYEGLKHPCIYTELRYKGRPIYENDVIREWIKDDQEPKGGAWSYSVIKMHQGSWCVCGINYEYKDPERLWDRLNDEFEIYGSIFDHQELLKYDTQPSN